MAVTRIGTTQRWIGLSGDSKPSSPPYGSTFYETNTGDTYIYNGSWLLAFHQHNKVIIADGAGHYLQLPTLTTTQRNALTPVNGMVIYNSTRSRIEVRVAGAWKDMGQVYGDATFLKLAGGEMSGNITMAGAETVDGVDVSAHAADIDAHMSDMFQLLKVGNYHLFLPHGSTRTDNVGPGQNTLYAYPFVVARPMTIDRLAIHVTTAHAGNSYRLGIYNSDGAGSPDTLLIDAGEVSAASTGVKAATISQALAKGVYYFAIVNESASAKVVGYPPAFLILGFPTTDFQTTWRSGVYKVHTYGALPDPFGAIAGELTSELTVFARLASLD